MRLAADLSIEHRGKELDQILVAINALDLNLIRVAKVSNPGIIVQTSFAFVFCGCVFLAGLGPRPEDPNHGWNVYGPDRLFLFVGALMTLKFCQVMLSPPA